MNICIDMSLLENKEVARESSRSICKQEGKQTGGHNPSFSESLIPQECVRQENTLEVVGQTSFAETRIILQSASTVYPLNWSDGTPQIGSPLKYLFLCDMSLDII